MSTNRNKAPNPLAFALITAASFATFYFVVQHREKTYPASSQPRHADHPLVPPIRKKENEK